MLSIKMPLFILCNANQTVGYGHFYRCLCLARQWQIETGVCTHWIGEIDKELHKTALTPVRSDLTNFIDIENWPLDTITALKDATKSLKRDFNTANETELLQHIDQPVKPFCLCDSYELTEDQIQEISSVCHLILIEDFGRWACEDAFAVINFTVDAHRYKYLSIHQLLGSKFFLCPPDLDEVRNVNLSNVCQKLEFPSVRITIAIGGFDRFKVGLSIAKALVQSQLAYQVKLLGNYDMNDIRKLKQNSLETSIDFIHISRTQDMATLYSKTDILISGGGLTKYESAYCGIPNIVVAQTHEQLKESYEFEQKGLCRTFGLASQLATELEVQLAGKLQKAFEDNGATANSVEDLTFIDWIRTFNWLDEAKELRESSREHFSNRSTENVVRQLLTYAEASVE